MPLDRIVVALNGRPVLLALRALGLGDFLTAVPALRALADAFPDHERVLAAPAPLEPLVRLTGAVDRVLPADGLAPLPLSGETDVDVAVNLHGCGPVSHRLLLSTRPARLIAFANDEVPESASGPPWCDAEHEVVRWCRLLRESGVAADASRLDIVLPHAPPRDRELTIVHPGAAFAARRWPLDRWAAVAAAETSVGRRVLITGSDDERRTGIRIAHVAGLPTYVVEAGRTNLVELAHLVARAGRIVCADSGVAHLATALSTPSVVLFGPDPPSRWGPPPDRPWHRVLWRGHTGDPRGDRPDAGLLEITVADVVEALDDLATTGSRTGDAAAPAVATNCDERFPGGASRQPAAAARL